MKKFLSKIWIIVFLFIFFTACRHTSSHDLDDISDLLDNNPDSALYLLRKINMENLSEKDQAEYALFYTTAQDKSGLDVDNDSLIRLAYEWYVKHPEDSLYAKCLYYMGKYYMLNDSTEQSVHCFKESYIRAFKQKDMKTGSLALEKLSKVVRDVNPKEAVKYSRKAVLSYNKCRQAKLANKIYLKLNYDEALSFVGHTRKAIEDIRLLLMDAYSLGDSTVLADVYQDLANFYLDQSLQDSSIFCANMAYSLMQAWLTIQQAMQSLEYNIVAITTLEMKALRTPHALFPVRGNMLCSFRTQNPATVLMTIM